jgi:multidrug resistance efflux pump
MVALAAISSATPSLQSSLMRSRLEAAKREADQAQAEVSQLRNQVSEAEANHQKRLDKVRRLSSEADPTYSTRLQPRQPSSSSTAQSLVSGSPVSTGRIVNTSA